MDAGILLYLTGGLILGLSGGIDDTRQIASALEHAVGHASPESPA